MIRRGACVLLALTFGLRYSGHRMKLKGVSLLTAYPRVYGRRGARALARAQGALGLNKSETGRLFGISRQAVDDWYANGVPIARVADVQRVADLATALHSRFISERVPQIVRTPMPGLDGESILQAIRSRGTVPVFEMLDRAFSYIPAE